MNVVKEKEFVRYDEKKMQVHWSDGSIDSYSSKPTKFLQRQERKLLSNIREELLNDRELHELEIKKRRKLQELEDQEYATKYGHMEMVKWKARGRDKPPPF